MNDSKSLGSTQRRPVSYWDYREYEEPKHEKEQRMVESMKESSMMGSKKEINMDLVYAIYRMKDIERFSGMPLIRKQNLSEHCYNVVNLFIEIADKEEVKLTQKDIAFVLRHDILETVTGDILRPAKELTKSIHEYWNDIEDQITREEEYVWMHRYTDEFAKMHMSPAAHRLFLDCDLLDILFTLSEELSKGNKTCLGYFPGLEDSFNLQKIFHLVMSTTPYDSVKVLARKACPGLAE